MPFSPFFRKPDAQQPRPDHVLTSQPHRTEHMQPRIDRVLTSQPQPLAAKPVDLPFTPGSKMALSHTAVTIDQLLSAEECRELIRLTEAQGYVAAEINVGGGRQRRMDDVRKSGRCIIDSEAFASKLWERLCPLLHNDGGRSDTATRGWVALELNERFRFLRYHPGEYFAPHQDGSYVRESGPKRGDRSFQTLMIYLNSGATRGGETKFLNPWCERETSVVPREGLGLLFDHDLHHEGARLERGIKYALRTDVMFRRVDAMPQLAASGPGRPTLDVPSGDADEVSILEPPLLDE